MKLDLTRSQERILHLLQELHRSTSAQDIYVELRNRSQGVGLATVYRALDALKLAGAVQVRTLGSGESLYSTLQEDKHHLTCVYCQKSIPIAECPVDQLEIKLQEIHQFKVYYHTLEFFGVCSICAVIHPPTKTVHHRHDH